MISSYFILIAIHVDERSSSIAMPVECAIIFAINVLPQPRPLDKAKTAW
jgi:hypothetical protein